MKIKVTGYLTWREIIGDQWLQVEDMKRYTLKDLLERLYRELGDEFKEMILDAETGEVSRYAAILINGRHHTHLPDGLDSELKDRDEVAIFPPIIGG